MFFFKCKNIAADKKKFLTASHFLILLNGILYEF